MLLQHIKNHFFLYLIVSLTILSVASSYIRFVVQKDYLVSYEGECEPYSQSCFVYCEDEECSEPFYYSIIEREANEIFDLCGTDVTTCDEAYSCQDNVDICSITFCDPTVNIDECELLTSEDALNEESNEMSI